METNSTQTVSDAEPTSYEARVTLRADDDDDGTGLTGWGVTARVSAGEGWDKAHLSIETNGMMVTTFGRAKRLREFAAALLGAAEYLEAQKP